MVEETKQEGGDQPRLQHLKQVEVSMQEQMTNQKLYEMEPIEGYESMSFEEKNATKFMSTFPFPYMNGHLHLGKFNQPQVFVVFENGLLPAQ